MKNKSVSALISRYGVLGVFIVMFVLFCFIAPNFFKFNNIFNVSRQISTLCICAVGMSMVMICGGIDLSVGYQISLVNVCCAAMMAKMGINPVIAVVVGHIDGLPSSAFINGVIIVKSGVMPLIVTLAVLNVLNGISFMVSRGLPIFGFPKSFSVIGQGELFGEIPVSLVIMTVILLLGAFVLTKVYWGRYFYAVGSNEEAAKLSGIKRW